MRSFLRAACLIALAAILAIPAAAQNIGEGEVIVTGSRIARPNLSSATPVTVLGYPAEPPVIGLKRTADFAVQYVTITGDTRDQQKRRDEIFAMVKGAIELAGRREGIELSTGTLVVEPLTLANYRNLPLGGEDDDDYRPDTDRVTFLVKTRLSAGVDAKAALERIAAFVKAVPTVGRAEIETEGELTLSVVGPEKYRGQIIDLVAADARATAARIGPDYAVTLNGADRPVEWSRASLTEVFLYVPYSYSVNPRR